MRAVDFAETGNIELVRTGRRELIGQLADGQFRIFSRYQHDATAQAKIEVCRMIAESYGVYPSIVYV